METFEDSFFWSLYYNDFNKAVEHLADLLDNPPDDFTDEYKMHFLLYKDCNRAEIKYEQDNMMQLLWMILVRQFGDYGCSPRTGWIEDMSGASKFLREQIVRTWNYEDDD